MNIGITYDLRDDYLLKGYTKEETAEFDKRDTIEAIEEMHPVAGSWHRPHREHIQSLTARLAAGDRWEMVFNIAEGLRGFGREAQVPALLDAYDIPYTFSDPLVHPSRSTRDMTKHVIRDLGIPTPDFFVVERESDSRRSTLPSSPVCQARGGGNGKGHQRFFQDRDAEGSDFEL